MILKPPKYVNIQTQTKSTLKLGKCTGLSDNTRKQALVVQGYC